jgi:hypothetical protein
MLAVTEVCCSGISILNFAMALCFTMNAKGRFPAGARMRLIRPAWNLMILGSLEVWLATEMLRKALGTIEEIVLVHTVDGFAELDEDDREFWESFANVKFEIADDDDEDAQSVRPTNDEKPWSSETALWVSDGIAFEASWDPIAGPAGAVRSPPFDWSLGRTVLVLNTVLVVR